MKGKVSGEKRTMPNPHHSESGKWLAGGEKANGGLHP